LLLGNLWITLAGGASAQEPSPAEVPTFGEEIVVSANRRTEVARGVPASVSIVSAEILASRPLATLDRVLEEEVPGFSLWRAGLGSLYGTAADRSISLRALGAAGGGRTLVLLDGVPLSDPLQGGVDWSRVAPQSVDRVEVIRTATSAAWGNLALGGVIHVITRDPEEPRLLAVSEAGELGLFRAEASVSGRHRGHGFLLAGRRLEQDGYHALPRGQRGPADERRGIEQNNAILKWHLEARPGLSYALGADWSSELRGQGSELSSDALEQLSVRAGGSWVAAAGLWQGHLYGQRQDQASRRGAFDTTHSAVTPSSDQFDIPVSVAGATAQWSRETGARWSTTAGGDGLWSEAEVDEDFRYTGGIYTRRRSFGGASRLLGIFAQEAFRPSPRWSLHLGARVDDWRLSEGRRSQRDLETGAVSAVSEFSERSRTVFSPTFGVVYQARPEAALRFALFSGFRAPTLFDLYRPGRGASRGVLESNPDLKPERLRGAESGMRLGWGSRGSLDVAMFWNLIDDPIISRTVGSTGAVAATIPPCGLVPAQRTCFQKKNVGELRSRGVETTLSWRPSERWRLRWNHSWSDSVVTEAPGEPQLVGKRNRHVPKHASVLALDWSHPRWAHVRLQSRYIGERFEDDLNSSRLPAYSLFDLSLQRDLTRGFAVFLNVANLLDRRYVIEEAVGATEFGPPRQATAGLRLGLGGR
jgi:outer membrane receptor protein involved in Fe transport